LVFSRPLGSASPKRFSRKQTVEAPHFGIFKFTGARVTIWWDFVRPWVHEEVVQTVGLQLLECRVTCSL